MGRFLLLSILIWSCGKQGHAPENSVSMIIYSDSVIIYSGPLKKSTAYQKIAIDGIKVKAILAKEKTNTSKELSILIKLSNNSISNDFMSHAENLRNWSIESGINNIVFTEMDAMDIAMFKLQPVPWAIVDSLALPTKLDLAIPKDSKSEDLENVRWPENKTLTSIILNDSIYCYTGTGLEKGSFYSLSEKTYRSYLQLLKKKTGDSLLVIIKPSSAATYKNTVDMLDEMGINQIERYRMIQLTTKEAAFLQIKK